MSRLVTLCSLLVVGLLAGSLRADTIQLAPNSQLTIDFSMPGFDPANPTALFPTTIGLQISGSVPSGTATSSIPGSTATYYSGMMLQGFLESSSGATVLPLFDADAWRLGLPSGDLVADSTGNGSAIISASVAVSLNSSEAIFGTTGSAEFVIKNLGGTLTIGLGPGYSLANAVTTPLSFNNGAVQSAGLVNSLQLGTTTSTTTSVPEPAAVGIAGSGAIFLLWVRRRFLRASNS